MANLTSLAHPYVNAVFDVANTSSSLDSWLDCLENLAAVTEDADFALLSNNPQIKKEDIMSLLLSVVKNSDTEMKNLINLLLEQNRLEVLPEIYRIFKHKVDELRGVAVATIQSPFLISADEQKEFEVLLGKKLSKKVLVEVEINQDLIGGVKILVNDLVIDASVKGGLEKMAAKII
jgi:F-type H+-transporting ATPase subunit delta